MAAMTPEVRSVAVHPTSTSTPAPSATNNATSTNNLCAPTTQPPGGPSLVRKLSQIATNLALTPTEITDKDLQLSDEAIRATGYRLLRDYVRDRLYRHGFLPSDEAWYKEENNNVINVSVSEIPVTASNNGTNEDRRLSVGRPLSRSNSFNNGVGGSKSPSTRNSFSIDGKPPDDNKAKIGKRDKSASSPSPLTIDSVAIHLRRFCLYLERKHSSVYREVSRPLNITMSSLEFVRGVFTQIADDVLDAGEGRDDDAADGNGSDDGGTTDVASRVTRTSTKISTPKWGKIASLYVLTSAFCIDCVVQGHADFLADVLATSAETIFRPEVVSWIRGVGGWPNLVEVARNNKKEPEPLQVFLMIIVGILVGVIATYLSSFRLPFFDDRVADA